MAFCAINMTLENRRDFGAIAMLLHMVLACAGAMLVFCYFVMRKLLEELHGLLHKHYSTVYVESVLILGVSMILIHGYGVKMCLHVGNWKKLYHKAFSWKVMMYLFLAVTFVFLLFIIAFLVVTSYQNDYVVAAGTTAMTEAIAQYKTNIIMKTAVDRVQLQNECCGSVTYVEWFHIPWIDKAYIPRDAPADATKFSFPFSCCSRRSERPCIDVDVNNEAAHYKYSSSTDVTVYRIGCNLGVTRVLREVVVDNLRFYGWIAFIFELLAFVLFRYVQTSTDVALTWADPRLICPGYLINIGAPAVPLSKTTNIEEFRRQQEKLEETIAMEEDMKIKEDDNEDEEEQTSRWHKTKKKNKEKRNRTSNNWNSNEGNAEEVIYANTGYSSNNNSATSADNSDNETMMLLMPSARRRDRRDRRRRGFRYPTNVTMSNRNVGESGDSSRRGSVSGSQPSPSPTPQQDAGQEQEEEEEMDDDDDEDNDEFEDEEEEEAAINWENELQDRASRRSLKPPQSLSSANVDGKPPLPPSAQRRLTVDGGGPPGAELTQVATNVGSLGGPADLQALPPLPVARRESQILAAARLSGTNIPPPTGDVPAISAGPIQPDVVGGAEPGAFPPTIPDDNQPSDQEQYGPDTVEPYEDFDDEEEMDMAGEGDSEPWDAGVAGGEGEGDDAGMFPDGEMPGDGKTADKDKKHRDKKDRSRDKKRGRDKKDGKERKGKDKKKGKDKHRKDSRDRKRGDKSRSRDRKGKDDSKRRKDSKGRKDRKRDSSKNDDRGRKSDRKGGGDKKRRDRTTSKKKKSGKDKKESRDSRGRSTDKKGDKRSRSGDKKRTGSRRSGRDKTGGRSRDKEKGGRSSGGRKSKRDRKGGGRSSGDRKRGGRSSGGRRSGGEKKGGKKSGGRKSGGKRKGGRSSGGRSGAAKSIKKGAKKLRRR